MEGIWACMTSTKTKPNLSTVQRSATAPDSLFELDRGTQEVVSLIMQNQSGGSVQVPGVEKVIYRGKLTDLDGGGSC
jgi:Chromatin associated protein KTI12